MVWSVCPRCCGLWSRGHCEWSSPGYCGLSVPDAVSRGVLDTTDCGVPEAVPEEFWTLWTVESLILLILVEIQQLGAREYKEICFLQQKFWKHWNENEIKQQQNWVFLELDKMHRRLKGKEKKRWPWNFQWALLKCQNKTGVENSQWAVGDQFGTRHYQEKQQDDLIGQIGEEIGCPG